MIDERHYEVFGRTYKRQWFLYALTGQTKSSYKYGRAEILDERPVEHLCSILAEHWGDEKRAMQLVKHGNIVRLGRTIKECVFSGEPQVMLSDPRNGALWSRFMEWKGSYWLADDFGRCKVAHVVEPRAQLDWLMH